MRTLLVVLVPEPVEGALLGADVAFGVLDELGQRAVEALLAAVLLRFPGRDAVVPEPQALPPHRQRGEAPSAGRRERRPVVGTDGLGGAELLERRVEDG